MVQPVPVDDRHLPDARDPVDASYQTLVRRLREETARITGERDHRLAEMNDYYTLWAHQIKTPIAAMRLLLADDRTDPGALGQELFKIEQYAEMVLHYLRLESLSADLVLRSTTCGSSHVTRYASMRRFYRIGCFPAVRPFFDAGAHRREMAWICPGQVLSNALKYTPRGSVTLRPDPADARALLIEDTGIGIRPEDIPRIFDRGFTGVNGRSELGQKSTGIGLYLARQVLTRLSHTISATSEVGRGTCIRIGFPDLTES
jgi:signal transduction histidine kinase